MNQTKCDDLISKIDHLLPELIDDSQLQSQAELLRKSAVECREFLANKNFKIAFIGTVGVGKTTAICRLFNIEDKAAKPLLSTGAGRVTLCEIEIRSSTTAKIRIEPVSNLEIETVVCDFVQLIANGNDKPDSQSRYLPVEIERCLRNMLELPAKNKKRDDGTLYKEDLAVEKFKELGSTEAFHRYAIEKLRWDQRTSFEMAPPPETDEDKWLKDTFDLINMGKLPDVPMPSRIVIDINRNFGTSDDLNITVLDTKGLDGMIEREDIDSNLNDSHTLSVICSRFGDAPQKSCQALLQHMVDIGLKARLPNHSNLMVLERGTEAEEVYGAEGDRDVGRLMRRDHIEDSLKAVLRLPKGEIPPTIFFNQSHHPGDNIHNVLIERVKNLRQRRISQIDTIDEAVQRIIKERKEAMTKAAFDAVYRAADSWAKSHKNTTTQLHGLYQALVNEINNIDTNAGTIRASVNRNGVWHNFDFYYKLCLETRKRSVASFEAAGTEFIAVLENLRGQSELRPAHSFIKQLSVMVQSRIESISEKSSLFTKKEFEPELKTDREFWTDQRDQWGQGPGYKGRIAGRTENWFRGSDHLAKEERIQEKLTREWNDFVADVESLAKQPAI